MLSAIFPDDREQITAYWAGILLELPVGWVSVYLLVKSQDTRGHSIEIWYASALSIFKHMLKYEFLLRITRFLGCIAAYGVFIWRYLNVPENWSYVGFPWSVGVMVLTVISKLIYPFVYIRVRMQKEKRL